MTEKEIEHYEKAQRYTDEILIKEIPESLNPKIGYYVSYASYFHYSNLNEAEIKLKISGYQNASISIGSALYETDKPYTARLWKYNGNHHFLDEQFSSLDECKEFIIKNLDFFTSSKNDEKTIKTPEEVKHGYEQLSLFDFGE